MIVSFKCRKTELLFVREAVTAPWREVETVALRKLTYLNSATKIEDLRIPPGNRLERLRGDQRKQYSIRINRRWRICFEFDDGNAHHVEIVDYH